MLYTAHEIEPGILECRLSLRLLYTDAQDRAGFEDRWPSFYASDPAHPRVYRRTEADILAYRSESVIPQKTDDRPPRLLLVGNPASHSILAGMCFAFERDGQEHRFWVGLRKAGLLDFREGATSKPLESAMRNCQRKQQLLNLDYASPFRIGITVFYTLPSPASQTRWAGVSGLRALFGKAALDRIAEAERQRIAQLVKSFLAPKGAMLVFQRDAYEAVRDAGGPCYSFALAKAGKLDTTFRDNPNVRVSGVAPTRRMISNEMHDVLVRYASYL
jgi:hypothetical protein